VIVHVILSLVALACLSELDGFFYSGLMGQSTNLDFLWLLVAQD